MKKQTVLAVTLGLALTASASVARAEDLTVQADASVKASVPKIETRMDAMNAKMDARVDAMQTMQTTMQAKTEVRMQTAAEKKAQLDARMKIVKAERKAKLDTAKKTRVEVAARASVTILTNALSRVENLYTRTTAQVAKMKASGVTTVEAEAKLGEAKVAWDAAQAKVASLDADVKVALESETPIASFETFRTHASEAKESIKTAHAKIVEAIVSLKGMMSASAPVNASSSVQVGQ